MPTTHEARLTGEVDTGKAAKALNTSVNFWEIQKKKNTVIRQKWIFSWKTFGENFFALYL